MTALQNTPQSRETRKFLLWMFTSLYFVQGVIQAYQLNFFKPHMDAAGIDPDAIAVVTSLALVPFVLKWIYGVISDKFSLFGRGHRVPYMQIGLVGTAVAFFVAYFIDPATSFGLLAVMVLAATFMMALFDTTADALAVDVMPPEDHTSVQAHMTGGRAAGLIILSGIFGLVVDRFGYQQLFLIIAALLLIPLWQVGRAREPTRTTAVNTFDRAAFRVLLERRYVLFGVFLVVAWTIFQGIDGLVTFYLAENFDSSGATIGWYGTLKGVGMVAGAMLMPRLVRRFGYRGAAWVTLAGVTAGGVTFSTLGSEAAIVAIAALWGIAVGLHWTTYGAFSMSVTDRRVAGTMFAIFGVMANIGLGVGELATALTDNVSFSSIFLTLGLVNLAMIPLIALVLSRFPTLASSSQELF